MEKFKLSNFVFIIIVCTALSHLLMPEIFSSQITQSIGLVLIFIVVYMSTLRRKRIFLFVMIIFIFSHFQLALNQGGAFNIVSFFTILLGLGLFNDNKSLNKIPPTLILLITLFLMMNMVGWLLNEESQISFKLLGMIAMFGFLSMFTLVSKINLTKEHIRIFLITSTVLLIWMAVVSLNMRFAFFITKSVIFGYMQPYLGSNRVASLFTYATSGEYSMLSLMIIFPFFLSKLSKSELNVNHKSYQFALLSIFILIILTQMRSNLFLSIGYLFLFYFVTVLKVKGKLFGQAKFYYIVIIFMIMFIFSVNYLQFDTFMDRVNELNFSSLSESESYTSGDQINRGYTTLIALSRVAERSWVFGFGWGSTEGNLNAWFGQYFRELGDPHSLYYSLIPIFGWSGTLFFMLIILYTLKRLITAIFKYPHENSYLSVTIYSFTFLFIFFLINQFKQTALSEPGYFMIFWIWLGLANAAVTTLNKKKDEELGKI